MRFGRSFLRKGHFVYIHFEGLFVYTHFEGLFVYIHFDRLCASVRLKGSNVRKRLTDKSHIPILLIFIGTYVQSVYGFNILKNA